MTSPKLAQRRVFVDMLEVAAAVAKPLIIHERQSLDDTLDVLASVQSERKTRLRGVFHCFGGTIEAATRILETGFMLSLTGVLTFKKNHPLRAVVGQAPLDRLMVETDAPYLSPEPVRHIRRCEPAFARHTVAKLAEVRGMSIEAAALATTATAERLFTGLGGQGILAQPVNQ